MSRGRRPPWAAVAVALMVLTVTGLHPGSTASAGTGALTAAAPGDSPTFTLGTVPSVAGFPVTLDGVTALTDRNGRAHFRTAVTEQDLAHRVALTEAVLTIDGESVRVRADRVYDSRTDPVLALDMSWRVRWTFARPDGTPVDPATIGAMKVKSETGEIVRTTATERPWLQGNRVIKRAGGMEIKDLRWSVQEVDYTGSNVVNASQQVFYPAKRQDVGIELLFFRLSVRVQDALYGFTTGDAVKLVYPNGSSRRFPLDDAGRLTVPALPRGHYDLVILGAGPALSRPLAVSRDQSLDMSFHSWVDIASILGALAALAIGLALFGWVRRRRSRADRPHPRHRAAGLRWHRRRHPLPAADAPTDVDAHPPGSPEASGVAPSWGSRSA